MPVRSRLFQLLVLGFVVLVVAGCSGLPPRAGADSPEAAAKTYALAVASGDLEAAAGVVDRAVTAEEIDTDRRDFLRIESPVEGPLEATVDQVIPAGEDPEDRGYVISIRRTGETGVLATATVYVGINDGRYWVWGMSS